MKHLKLYEQLTAKAMAEEHWLWVEKILLKQLEFQHILYVDAMIHGFEHGVEEKTEGKT